MSKSRLLGQVRRLQRSHKSNTTQSRQSTVTESGATSTVRAAFIAAIAAIIAAILSLGGAIWSGFASVGASDRAAAIGAKAAIDAVSVQLSGETERSRAEFARGQRQRLFSRISAHEVAFIQSQDKLDKLAHLGSRDSKFQAERAKSDLIQRTLELDRFELRMISETDSLALFDAMLVQNEEYVGATATAAVECPGLNSEQSRWCNKIRYEPERTRVRVVRSLDALIEGFRTELEST